MMTPTASLSAMVLVSQVMLSSAIPHLFSLFHFACAEDFASWLAIVRRTPRLLCVVRLARHRSFIRTSTLLHGTTIPPLLPLMPSVKVVGGILGFVPQSRDSLSAIFVFRCFEQLSPRVVSGLSGWNKCH
ncbi:hypothetical protein C8J57DRAFT_1545199 [Mycena rebaudengoi]|nr:hypothetical protein C8J57DRAFT_1545199 [Mycena rebaudengoi]